MPKTIKKGELAEQYKNPLKYFREAFPTTIVCGTCGTKQEVSLSDLNPDKNYLQFSCSECGWDQTLGAQHAWIWEGWEKYKELYLTAKPEEGPKPNIFVRFWRWF